MILKGINIAGKEGLQNIHIENGYITAVTVADTEYVKDVFLFHKAIAFPGLINSHDHLDFNLFPQLGSRHYANYTQWGKDIHEKNKEEINAVLKIPQVLRVQWGMYKNLLNGVTTVVNHGEQLAIPEAFIAVFQKCISLHSPSFEKRLKGKLRNPFNKNKTVVMHIGEGTDDIAHNEIDKIINMNTAKKNIVAVHGVAMNPSQAVNFKALVWCPGSNYFLLGKTAPVNELKNATTILFGSDSTLSSGWNIWDHIRIARKEERLSDEELLNSLTINAAKIWQLKRVGTIAPQMQADIVIARKDGACLFDTDPEDILIVIKEGKIRLFDEMLLQQVMNAGILINNFSKININGQTKYVYGDLPVLMNKIKQYYPGVTFPFQTCD